MRRYLGIEFADWRALALENGVQLAVAGRLGLAEGSNREGGEESVDQRMELCRLAFLSAVSQRTDCDVVYSPAPPQKRLSDRPDPGS